MKILALESSTTSAKAMIYDTDTRDFQVESVPYKMESSEGIQDAEEVFQQMVAMGKELCKGQKIDMVALGSEWHSVVLCDENMKPQTPVYHWTYLGAVDICKNLRNDKEFVDWIYQKTGCMVNAIYPVYKIMLLKEQGYDVTKYRFMGQSTYNTYRLTNEWVVTDSMASAAGLLNLHEKDYDLDIIEKLGTKREQYPKVIRYDDIYPLTQEGAELLGLEAGIPVLTSNPDGGLNQVGAGATKEGIMTLSLGTSGALRMSVSKPLLPKKPSVWCYYSPKSCLSGAATSGCCNCIDWFKKKYFPAGTSFAEMENGCEDIANTPVFLPFLFGERCPGWEDERTGSFFKLKSQHTLFDMYRAIQEGVLFNLYQCYEELVALNGEPKQIMLSGGIVLSKLWTQMAADIFQKEMTIQEVEHSSLMGSIALSMELLGVIEDASDFVSENNEVIAPNPEMKAMYQAKYADYFEMYAATK